MLETARDPFTVPWWSTESSIDSSPRLNSSFGRVQGSLSRLNVEPENGGSELDLTLEGARKKLTWISREDYRTPACNYVGSDRPSIQNGAVNGRSSRFRLPDSPGRAIYQPPESPSIQSGSTYGRSGRFVVPDSPGRGILNVPESPTVNGRSSRFGIPDSPGRAIYQPSESPSLQSGSAYGRSARFVVPDSPGRGILNVPESPTVNGRSSRFGIPDSPGRAIYQPSESPSLQSGSAFGRSARFVVPDSPGRGILNVPESPTVNGRSSRFGIPDSPGRAIYQPSESPSLQSGSAYGRSARFVVPDSPGRGILNVPESPTVNGRSSRFGIPDSPGRAIYQPPESPSLQSGSAYGRSARFVVPDSPGRGILNVPESPARRGESVRQIRTPSTDSDMREVPSSATASRRLGPQTSHLSSSSKEVASLGTKSDDNVAREANPIRRLSTSTAARVERISPKPRVQPPTDDSTNFSPILDSPEGDRMAVSYLADETDRIIKGRIRKLHLRPHDSNAADQLRTADHEKSSAGETRIANEGRRQTANSPRQIDRTKAERVDPAHDKHRVGGLENDSDVPASRSATPRVPGSPLVPSALGERNGPSRRISSTMENYLESRRRGLGTQIIAPSKQAIPSPRPSLAFLKQARQPENPSTSSKIGVGSRHDVDRLNASRAALSPLNGNEDVSHSTTSLLQQSKEEYVSEDPNYRERTRDSNAESVQVQGENGFPSRLQYWAEFLGKGEINAREGLRHLTQPTEEITSPSGRKELGIKLAPVRHRSDGAQGHSSQERRLIDSPSRQPADRTYSQRYEEVGRTLLSEKSFGPRENYKSSRRSQSCRRDSIINSLLDSSQENEALPASGKIVLPSGIDTSSDSKNSRRVPVEMHLSSSSDTIQGHSAFLSHTEKAKFVFVDSPDPRADRKSSRRSSAVAVPESTHENPSSGLGNPPLHGPFSFPKQTDKPKHRRTSSQGKARASPMDLSPMDSTQVTEKKKNGDQLAHRKKSHRRSRSFDQDVYKKLMAKTRDNNRTGPTASTLIAISQACPTNPKATKPRPSSPGASIQRWIANHFKLGSKPRSNSTGKIRDLQAHEEQKPRKKSPWRAMSAEIFQGITRKKGSSKGASNGQLLDAQGLKKLRSRERKGASVESETQFQLDDPDPWRNRMAYRGAGCNFIPPHRHCHMLPSISAFSPAHSKGLQNLFRNRRRAEVPIAVRQEGK